MFKEEQSPVAEFRGYRVRTFRQLRANLAERTLQGRVVHFVPWKGVAGVFIPAQEYPADAAALEEAWAAAGSPSVHLPGPGETLLFGRVLPVRTMPFAGYDDLVEESDALCVACKRAPDPEDVAGRVEAYRRATLLARANALLEGWGDRLTRRPADLVVWARLKHRTLGQCMRSGEIRLLAHPFHSPPRLAPPRSRPLPVIVEVWKCGGLEVWYGLTLHGTRKDAEGPQRTQSLPEWGTADGSFASLERPSVTQISAG